MTLREDADHIIERAVKAVLPDSAVKRALEGFEAENVYVVSIGKAAWRMAKAASEVLGDKIADGVVITKYGHVSGDIPKMTCYEAGHPVADENGFAATEAAIELVSGLRAEDSVLFLVSGGGSALFEKPLVDAAELQNVSRQLLACGADIIEINTVRKRLSAVKGGRFAELCRPAKVFSIVLSDIIGDPLSMIASGPACPDESTCGDAKRIAAKYCLNLSDRAKELLEIETVKKTANVETVITGSVRELCRAAAEAAEELGYAPVILTDRLNCEAREAGSFLGAIARTQAKAGKNLAFIAGGETVVHLSENCGKGGRNQEIALAAAAEIDGLENAAVFSVGSDGTDGPTDAAGGFADGFTKSLLAEKNVDIHEYLSRHDAYSALESCGGLMITGPTGTNVNDVAAVLVRA